VSNITVDQSLLPEIYQMNIYLNDPGTGTGLFWGLSSAPTGVTINSSTGAMTVAANTSINTHGMSLVVTNSAGSDSEPFDLTVQSAAPVFTVQPTNQSETEPDAAVFGPVVATNAVSARWEAETAPGNATWSADLASIFGGRASGATGDTLTITPTDSDDDRGIRVIAIASGGAETSSNEVTLHVAAAGGELPYFHEFNADLGGFVFTRSSSAWGVAEDGIFYESTTDEPVYPGAGNDGAGNWTPHAGFKGLLLEGAGENHIADPTTIGTASWTNTATTIISADVASPIDGLMADKLQEDSSASNHTLYQEGSWIDQDNLPVMNTFICKGAGRLFTRMQLQARADQVNRRMTYEFSTGEFTNVNSELTLFYRQVLADGWAAVYQGSETISSGTNTGRTEYALSDGIAINYQGDGASGNHLAAVQTEIHPFPTSLMLNGTRAATSCTQTLADMGFPSGLTNDFTIRISYVNTTDRERFLGVNATIFELYGDASNLMRFWFRQTSATQDRQSVVKQGDSNLNMDVNNNNAKRGDVTDLVIVASSTQGMAVYRDGELVASNPTGTTDFDPPLTEIYLGDSFSAGNNHHNLIIRELDIYPFELTPLQIWSAAQ